MTTYMIAPQTTLTGYDIKNPMTDGHFTKGEEGCRRLCDMDDRCEAFVWKPQFNGVCDGLIHKQSINECSLKMRSGVPTQYDPTATLYVKQGRKNFWLLWLFLIVLGVIVFVSFAQRGMKKV